MTAANTVSPTLREPLPLGQTVVVIGGSSGIGLKTAGRVRAEGADFCLGGDVREWAGVPAAELRPKIEVFADSYGMMRNEAHDSWTAGNGKTLDRGSRST